MLKYFIKSLGKIYAKGQKNKTFKKVPTVVHQQSTTWTVQRLRTRPCSTPGRGAKNSEALSGVGRETEGTQVRTVSDSRCESVHTGSQVGPTCASGSFDIQRHLLWGLKFLLWEGCAACLGLCGFWVP